jgi:amino acid permease
LLVFTGIFVLGQFFPTVPLVMFSLVFSILLFLLWFFAGKVVFDSLMETAGTAGVIVSVIIFLSTSYCNLPEDIQTADDSLKFLFSFGLLYAGFLFYGAFRKNFDTMFDELKKGPSKEKTPWWILALFVLLIILFLWQFYLVVNPIIHNLCIYK